MDSTTTTSNSPELDESELALLKLSRRIDMFYIHQLKVVLSGLDITKTRTSQKSALNDLFGCVKEKIPDKKEALTFLCQVLEILGWSDLNDLKPYILSPANYDTRTRHKWVDIRLTVLQFVYNLKKCDFEILRACVCSHCGVAVDRIENRAILVEVIFDEVIKKDKDVHVTLIYRIACCFNREEFIVEYCKRHNISLPEVNEDSDGSDLVNQIQRRKEETSAHLKVPVKASEDQNHSVNTSTVNPAPEQVSGQQEPSGDTRYTTTPNPAVNLLNNEMIVKQGDDEAGETDGTSEIQGVNRLSLSPGPDFPSKPIISDDGDGLLSAEVEGDQPKKREYSVITDSDDSFRIEKGRAKQGDGIPQSDSEAKLLETKDEKSNEVVTDVTTVDSTAKRNAEKCTSICRLLLCVLAVFFGLAVIVFLILLAIELSKISQSQNGSVNVTDCSLVAINPDGFEGDLNNVRLTLETEDDRTEVEVFKQPCDEVSVSSHNLTVRNMQELVSEYFNRQAYNYNGEDKPIYGVEGSVLYFTLLSSNASDADLSFCPRLSVFNNNNLYQDAIGVRVNVEGDIAQSPCFPVNTSDTPAVGTWSYTFENSEYIYVTIEKDGGVVVNGMISGTRRLYDDTPDLGCSNSNPLIFESRTCIVDICKKECVTRDPPKQCIFLQSNRKSNSEIKYETERAYFTYMGMIYTVTTTGALLCCFLVLLLLVCLSYCCARCNIKHSNRPPNPAYRNYHSTSHHSPKKSLPLTVV